MKKQTNPLAKPTKGSNRADIVKTPVIVGIDASVGGLKLFFSRKYSSEMRHACIIQQGTM